ncbi:MAG: hypothetical protein V1493_02410 [Candidatus Diapherotrites archaeon]
MKHSERRGQAALEYLIIAATLMLATAVMLGYVLPAYSNATQIEQAGTALNILTAAADKVYALGPGSALVVEITLPSGVNSITASENFIAMDVEGSTSLAVFDFNITPGTIPPTQGYHKIQAEAIDENVKFSEVT